MDRVVKDTPLWLLGKLTVDSLTQFRVPDTLDTADEVLNHSILVTRLAANDLPQCCRLDEVFVGDFAGVGGDLSHPLFVVGV